MINLSRVFRSSLNLLSLRKKEMTDVLIYSKISTLPPNLKREVVDFVDFLQTKKAKVTPKKQRIFGYAKGAIVLKPGFDDPLEDFKDYM